MSDFWRRLFTPFASSPRRWLWVGVLVGVLAFLALGGYLR